MHDMVAMPLVDVLTARAPGRPAPVAGAEGLAATGIARCTPTATSRAFRPSRRTGPAGSASSAGRPATPGSQLVRCMDPQLSFRQAVQALGGDIDGSARRKASEPRPWPKPMPPSSEAWSRLVDSIAAEGEAHLRSDAGTRARRYLSGRGLSEHTIREAGLRGYWPAEDDPYGPGHRRPDPRAQGGHDPVEGRGAGSRD